MRGRIDPHRWDAYTDDCKLPHEKRCMAKSRSRPGMRCRQTRVAGYDVCGTHGHVGEYGKTLKNGSFSKHLGPLAEKYKASFIDREGLMNMMRPLAILEAILKEHAELASAHDVPEFRSRAWKLFEESRALASTDPAKAAEAMNELGQLLRNGETQSKSLLRLEEAAERLSKRQEGTWKVKLLKQQAINGQELHLMLARLLDIISQETSPDHAMKIGMRFDTEISMGRAFTADGKVLHARN